MSAVEHRSLVKALEECKARNAALQNQAMQARVERVSMKAQNAALVQKLHEVGQERDASRTQLAACERKETVLRGTVSVRERDLFTARQENWKLQDQISGLVTKLTACQVRISISPRLTSDKAHQCRSLQRPGRLQCSSLFHTTVVHENVRR